jgi:PPP family 3-phenylpropionic acid transporter
MYVSLRFSLFYAAVFLAVGIQMPYWPVWLTSRGLDANEIALLLAVGLWVKVTTNPLAGIVADRSGRRRPLMIGLSLASLAGFLLLIPAQGIVPIFALGLATSACLSALIPLGDNLAIAASMQRGLSYGRMRLWGSVSFIAASLASGASLGFGSADAVLYLLIAAFVLATIACAMLPADGARPVHAMRSDWRILVADRRQLWFIAAAMPIQASHSVYYAFGTLHWLELGHSSAQISWLWAEGVVAEIAIFFLGSAVLRRTGAANLLLLAGAAAAVRWSATAVAETLPALLLLQLLHGLTFGGAHLAAMHFIGRAIPSDLSATAQAMYSAVVQGLGFGAAMLLAGALYARFGAAAYFAMALLGAVGAGAAFMLGRRWRGELLATLTERDAAGRLRPGRP